MIETLEDAWKWYESAVKLHKLTQRIGRRFWDRGEWAAALAADNHFRDLGSPEIAIMCETFESELDDLAVLVLFSVFEAIVSERVRDEIDRETPGMKHPFLIQAVQKMKESLKTGSFFQITEAYKSIDSDLAEEVFQVRRFRNWVAHGRRGEPAAEVTPRVALDRLTRFLDRIGEPAGTPIR